MASIWEERTGPTTANERKAAEAAYVAYHKAHGKPRPAWHLTGDRTRYIFMKVARAVREVDNG